MALGKGLNSLIPQRTGLRNIIRKETGVADTSAVTVWQIPISEIIPNPEQPRKEFSHTDLENLVASIKEHGIIQPLVVTEKDDGGYELIAGERRLRASQIAGLATVPAIVRSATQQQKLELALIENIQRQNLNPLEEGFAYERLMQEFGLTQEQVAQRVGKSRPVVANAVRLLDLPEPIQKALVDGTLNAGKARAILSLKDEKEQMELFKSLIGEHMSVRDVEHMVESHGPQSRKGSVRRDPNVQAQEQLLEERLGTRVRIAQRGERGTIAIEFNSREELKRLMGELT